MVSDVFERLWVNSYGFRDNDRLPSMPSALQSLTCEPDTSNSQKVGQKVSSVVDVLLSIDKLIVCRDTITGKESVVSQDVESRARSSDIGGWVWLAELVEGVARSGDGDAAVCGTLFAVNGAHVWVLCRDGNSGNVVCVEGAHRGIPDSIQRLGATSWKHRGVDSRYLRNPWVGKGALCSGKR